MPCPTITSSGWFNQERSTTRSPRTYAAELVPCSLGLSRLRSPIFSASMQISRPRMVAGASSVTAICPSGMTGIGPVAVCQPRVRDRKPAAGAAGRIRFTPSILPPYMRRSKSIETLLPILYLKGISTGDFSEALAALLGEDAAGLSASAVGRLREGWQDDHAAWQKRDLSARRYVYVWADGIYFASPARRREAVHSRADWCDAGRPQGARRVQRWCEGVPTTVVICCSI